MDNKTRDIIQGAAIGIGAIFLWRALGLMRHEDVMVGADATGLMHRRSVPGSVDGVR